MVNFKFLFLIKQTRKIMKLCKNCKPRKPERFFLLIRIRQSLYDEDIKNDQSMNFQYLKRHSEQRHSEEERLTGQIRWIKRADGRYCNPSR